MHSVEKFFDVANQSAAALNRKIIEINLRNFNSGLDLAKSLAGARNPFEVVQLVASFWWKQFDELRLQAEDVQNRLFGFSVPQLKFKSAEPVPDSRLWEPASNHPSRAHPSKIATQRPTKLWHAESRGAADYRPGCRLRGSGPHGKTTQGSNPRKEINEPSEAQIQLACSCPETAEAKA
jgi:hypothetical protein